MQADGQFRRNGSLTIKMIHKNDPGRLSTISPSASRLTSAKLSAAGKPQPASWASPVSANKAASPMAATSSSGGSPSVPATSNAASGPSAPSSTITASATSPKISSASPAPRLATALSTTAARSSSPRLADTSSGNRGSPSVRNATLGSLNRSQSPATSTSGTSTAPWANIKSTSHASVPAPRFANPDFPTAAEAAAAKKAQEEKEKAEAAEAAARHEAHLRQIDRFRGTNLGSGQHWDELDDDEDGGFLDEVVEFADGTKYNVHQQPQVVDPAKLESQVPQTGTQEDPDQPPITKDQRFKDVDHDRSWPLKAPTASTTPAAAAKPASLPAPAPPTTRRTTVRETLDIMPGAASIALDDPMAARSSMYDSMGRSRMDRDGGFSRGGRFDRDYPHEGNPRDSRSSQDQKAPAAAAAARAWGPLAVRQQSLNPNAPKVEAASAASPPSQAPAPAAPPKPAPETTPTGVASRPAPLTSPTLLRRDAARDPTPAGRNVPQQPQSQQRAPEPAATVAASAGSPTSNQAEGGPSPSTSRAAPWARRGSDRPPSFTQQQQPDATSPPHPAASAAHSSPVLKSPQLPQQKPDDQASEMLSAAERARRRRQEEEAQREAERERARQKALAIEERMRKEQEAKEEAARKAREEAEAEKRRQEEAERQRQQEAQREQEEARKKAEEARLAAEKAAREAEEAAAAKRANVWRPKSIPGFESAKSPEIAAPRSPQRQTRGIGGSPQGSRVPSSQPPVHSASDEAASWRRPKAPPPAAPPAQAASSPSAGRATTTTTPGPLPTRGPASPQRSVLKRPAGGFAPSALDSMANLDDVIGRIRGAMQNGGQIPPVINDSKKQQAVPSSADAPRPVAQPPILTPNSPPRLLVNPDRPARAAAPAPTVPKPQDNSLPAPGPTQPKPLPIPKPAEPQQSERTSTIAAAQTPSAPPQPKQQAPPPFPHPKAIPAPAAAASPQPRVKTPVVPEPLTTREEPAIDDKPAWNRYKVSLKPSVKPARLSKTQFQAQKSRAAAAANSDNAPPAGPYILSWEPPIQALSARTLNRDDHFFAKKFRKGKVISLVTIPSRRLPKGPPAELGASLRGQSSTSGSSAQLPTRRNNGPEQVVNVKLPGSSARFHAAKTNPSTVPTGPAAPTALRPHANQGGPYPAPVALPQADNRSPNSAADQLAATRPELDFGAKQRRRGSATTNGVAFAHNAPVGDLNPFGRDTPSPVNFMVTSELQNARAAQNGGSSALLSGPAGLSGVPVSSMPQVPTSTSRSASHTPLLPSTGLGGSSTWGQGPLSFLDTPKSAASGGADAGRIKDVWSRPDGEVSNSASMTPTQNSLRDIGDDFLPSTLAISLSDLKVDEGGMPSSHVHDSQSRFGGYGNRGGLGGSSSSAFRTPSASAAYGDRRVQPHLGVGGSPQSKFDFSPSEQGGGSNSAPSTSPNLLRSNKNVLGPEPSAMSGQRGPDLYPSAYIDIAGDPFRPKSPSTGQTFGSRGERNQQALYTSGLGPVETSGFGAEASGYRSGYGSSSGYGTWGVTSPGNNRGSSNAYSGYGSGAPTASRMPFANRQQSSGGQGSRGSYAYGGNAYGNSFSGGRNQGYGSSGGISNNYRSYGSSGSPDQDLSTLGSAGRGGQSSSSGLSSTNYGAGRDTSLVAAVGGPRSAAFTPRQQYQSQSPQYARYQGQNSGGYEHNAQAQQHQYSRGEGVTNAFNKASGASIGGGVDETKPEVSQGEQQGQQSTPTAAASLWQQ